MAIGLIVQSMTRGRVKFMLVDEQDLDVKAFLDGSAVGQAWGTRDGDTLKLEDIEIKDAYRHRRIGSALLTFMLRLADSAGIREIWGVVTAEDLKQTPSLLNWYERNGFITTEPDADTDPRLRAVKKIVRRR